MCTVQPTEIVLTWTTFNATANSTTWYGIAKMDQVAYGWQTLFTDDGPEKRVIYMHRVKLSSLQSGASYSEFTFEFTDYTCFYFQHFLSNIKH